MLQFIMYRYFTAYMTFIKQAIQIRTIGHRQKRNFVCNTERKDNFEEKKAKTHSQADNRICGGCGYGGDIHIPDGDRGGLF